MPVLRPGPDERRMVPGAPRGGERGFALLAALLIAAIGLLATASLLAAALSSASISADDSAAARASDAAAAGVADALQRLRWGWLSPDASSLPASFGPVDLAGASYTVTVAPLSGADLEPRLDDSSPLAVAAAGVVACRVDSLGAWGRARRTVHVVALATPDALPRGLVVGAGATIRAPLALSGCGLYAGGDVDGREWVTLSASGGEPTDAPPTPDLAYGGLYPLAGVHAAGHITVDGADEHAGAGAPAADSDADTGTPPPADLVAAPGPASLGGFKTRASDPVAALIGANLDLGLLDRSAPPPLASTSLAAGGRIYVLDASGGPPALTGERPAPPAACPLTVVVLGDCTIGGSAGAAFSGALVVTGTLTVQAPLRVDGGLYAGGLVVAAPLTVRFSGVALAPGSSTVRDVSWRQ